VNARAVMIAKTATGEEDIPDDDKDLSAKTLGAKVAMRLIVIEAERQAIRGRCFACV
jgi:hypothetical protein